MMKRVIMLTDIIDHHVLHIVYLPLYSSYIIDRRIVIISILDVMRPTTVPEQRKHNKGWRRNDTNTNCDFRTGEKDKFMLKAMAVCSDSAYRVRHRVLISFKNSNIKRLFMSPSDKQRNTIPLSTM